MNGIFCRKWEADIMSQNNHLFISHSSKDIVIVEALVELLVGIGIDEKSITCTSVEGTHIHTAENIMETLRNVLDGEQTVVFFILSPNFYESPVCLNEMGAVWVKRAKYYSILVPGFSRSDIAGVIDKDDVNVSLSNIDDMVKAQFFDIRNDLERTFGIQINDRKWEKGRDRLFEAAKEYQKLSLKRLLTMQDAKGYCIGDLRREGCQIVKKESSENETLAVIDFTKTESDLCSVVYFTEQTNWKGFYQNNAQLSFYIYIDSVLGVGLFKAKQIMADVELHMKNHRDERYPIRINMDRFHYKIPLVQFSESELFWEEVREISFLFYRQKGYGIHTFKVRIENLCVVE
jgi:hypothetical protein